MINDAADKFGSQCVVVAIDAKRRADGSGWNVYKNGGRIDVGLDGGAGNKEHFYDTLTEGKADAALAASLFHFNELKISDLKEYLDQRGISVRR